MQKRFCSCGQAVMVDYMFSGSFCDTMFRSENQARMGNINQGEVLLCCPHCNALLNINELF